MSRLTWPNRPLYENAARIVVTHDSCSTILRIITRRGIEVRLGNSENMPDKIAWMKSAVADLENRGQNGGVLDVSSGTKADYRAS